MKTQPLNCFSKIYVQAIFWDDQLTGPIGLVAEYSFLKESDVVKMFQLKAGPLPSISVKNIIFVTRPYVEMMDCIADNLHWLVYNYYANKTS